MKTLISLLSSILGKLLDYSDYILGYILGRKHANIKKKERDLEVIEKQRNIANSPDRDPIDRMRNGRL